jgi:hypothetical protein
MSRESVPLRRQLWAIKSKIVTMAYTRPYFFCLLALIICTFLFWLFIPTAPKVVKEWDPKDFCTGFVGPETPKPKAHQLCMITRVRNSAEWLPEWIEYHHLLGASKLFIADDCSNDNGYTRKILEYYGSLGFVQPYFEYDARHPCGEKWKPDEDYLISWTFQRAKKDGCDWIAMTDIDEFIVYLTPEWQQTQSLLPYLSQSLLPFVKLLWLEMSTEGHIEKPKGLTIESSHNIRSDPRHSKSIVRADAISDWTFSHFSSHWEPHLICIYDSGARLQLQKLGTKIVTLPNGSTMKLPKGAIALKHFMMRSYEEFQRSRGKSTLSSSNAPNIYKNNSDSWRKAQFTTFDPSTEFTEAMAKLVRQRLKSRDLPSVPFLPELD